jgi:hypothetical protein
MIQEDEVELEGIYIPEPSTSAFRQLDLVQQNTQDSEDIQDIQDTQENETADDDESYDEPKLTFLPRRRVKRHVNRRNSATTFEHVDSEIEDSEFSTDNEQNTDSSSDDDTGSTNNEEFPEIFEDYSCPEFDPFQITTETIGNNKFLWILIWIMSFRTRYNLPETATESLLKFIKLLLKEIGSTDFDRFPDTLYLMRKELDIKDRFHSFAACSKCHKLYKQQVVENFREDGVSVVMKCQHVEYPNSTKHRENRCQTALTQKTKMLNGQISYKPILTYPFVSIQQQLAVMFRRPGFEKSLRHWANRSEFDNTLTDIYDGQVWKNFKDTTVENSPLFFRSEVADSHLGLMLNLDWFQPFEGTIHSTGAIYAAICNLPRDIRFRRENLLLLGLLPGPNEVSLHKINHYLAPVVNDLISLWAGVTLNSTFEYQKGRNVRAALILVSCDIPAARKICGHISALASCHRCEKKANYENRKHNFAGMADMDEWFILRDSDQHRQDAYEWRRCNSNASRKRFVQQNGVRWSELLRLTYFDPIRFIIVDPMHCLFLGIAKWIVKRIWIENDILTKKDLKQIQTKMNKFQVPSDVGRIPKKIDCGKSFSNLTADQ